MEGRRMKKTCLSCTRHQHRHCKSGLEVKCSIRKKGFEIIPAPWPVCVWYDRPAKEVPLRLGWKTW